MRTALMLGAVLGLAAFCWRTVGWIRLEPTTVDQKRAAWSGEPIRYRRTQDGDKAKLRIGWWKRRRSA